MLEFICAVIAVIIIGICHTIKEDNKANKDKVILSSKDIDEKIYEYIDKNNISKDNVIKYTEDFKILGINYQFHTIILFDSNKRNIYVFVYSDDGDLSSRLDKILTPEIIKYDDIIECQLVEDDAVIQSGGVGRAIAGGVIAGSTGAIVGATTRKSKSITSRLEVHVITKDISDSLKTIRVIYESIDKKSDKYNDLYRAATKIYSTIISIIDSNKNVASNNISSNGIKDKLRELKDLYDDKLITKDEYDKTREELLNKY